VVYQQGVRKKKGKVREEAYHTIKFVNIVVIIVIIVIVIVLIFREHVVFERFAGEIIDSTWYDLQTGMEGEEGRKDKRVRWNVLSP